MPRGVAPPLRALTLVVTSACNQSCAYCLQGRRSARRMSDATAAAGLDWLLRSRRRSLGLAFYGGEPLLAKDLVRRTIERARERRPANSRLQLSLSTNGLLLDAATAAFLAAHEVRTQLSFDGSRASQELRSPGTYDAVSRLLDRLQRDEPRFFARSLAVAATVTPENQHLLSESVAELLARGVETIALGPRLGGAVAWDRAAEAELQRQLRSVYRQVRAVHARSGRVPVTLFRRTFGGSADPGTDALCRIGDTDDLTLDVDGEVYGCPLLAESCLGPPRPGVGRFTAPLRVGRIDAADLPGRLRRFAAEVRRSPLFAQRGRKHSGRRRCADCRFRGSCAVCPVGIALARADPQAVPAFLCAWNRQAAHVRRRFPPQWEAGWPGRASR